jgi:hypothetical protein
MPNDVKGFAHQKSFYSQREERVRCLGAPKVFQRAQPLICLFYFSFHSPLELTLTVIPFAHPHASDTSFLFLEATGSPLVGDPIALPA